MTGDGSPLRFHKKFPTEKTNIFQHTKLDDTYVEPFQVPCLLIPESTLAVMNYIKLKCNLSPFLLLAWS